MIELLDDNFPDCKNEDMNVLLLPNQTDMDVLGTLPLGLRELHISASTLSREHFVNPESRLRKFSAINTLVPRRVLAFLSSSLQEIRLTFTFPSKLYFLTPNLRILHTGFPKFAAHDPNLQTEKSGSS